MSDILLLADNNNKFRETWGRVLSAAGYQVKFAAKPSEARDILQHTGIDLAILDVRLEADDDQRDFSGLDIALDKAFRHIPKIVLTGFPISPENLRKTLGLNIDELPAAVAFVNKTEKDVDKKLLETIRHALEVWPHLRISTAKVIIQIRGDHHVIREQAKRHYIVAFAVAIFGFLMICTGIFLAWFDKLAVGIVGTTSGLILEALSFLFFTRLDHANERMDIYHTELVQTYWLELLLAVCEQLPSEKQIICKERVIGAAISSWFSATSNGQAISTIKQQD